MISPDLIVLNSDPLCAEAPLERQEDLITPTAWFYVRNHFPEPQSWPGLLVEGAVAHPLSLSLRDLEGMPRRGLVATLECAGNGRAYMDPPIAGEQWKLGAASTAEWEGVPLPALLERSELEAGVLEVVIEAADGFARSLPLDRALHADTLLALGMNGHELPRGHGGPLRLLVPGWYGMASVKWVTRLTAVREPFRGQFQVEKYTIEGQPLREMAVRSVIVSPPVGATVSRSPQTVRGFAWSGGKEVTAVELSEDGGRSWLQAALKGPSNLYAWRGWEVEWVPSRSGAVGLLSRATDSAGRTQPLQPVWNRQGYGNNAAVAHQVSVA